MAIRICIYCEKEKDSKQFWIRGNASIGACYGCMANKFRDYEATKISES